MDIKKELPFDQCETCSDFILKVREEFIYSEDHHITKLLIVCCKNESLCRRLDTNRKRCRNENGH